MRRLSRVTSLDDPVAESIEVGARQRWSVDDERVEVEAELADHEGEGVVEGGAVEQV